MTEVVGMVEGEPGQVFAGWAKLSARRHAGGTLRVRTATGIVELVVPDDAQLAPVETVTGTWQDHETHPAAKLVIADAPAPGEDIELTFALVRGGDAIAAWGTVEDTVLETETGQGAFRSGATERPSRVRARYLATGTRAADLLAELRADDRERKAKKQAAAKSDAKSVDRTAAVPTTPGGERSRELRKRWTIALAVSLGAAAIACGAAAIVAVPVIVAVAAIAVCAPLVVDELLLPDLHPFGKRAKTGPAIAAGTMFFVAAGIELAISWGCATLSTATTPERIARFRAAQVGELVVAGIAIACALLTWRLDRGRRRILGFIANAPPHPVPLTDGVWGATEGSVGLGKRTGFKLLNQSVIAAVGANATSYGSGKNTTVSESKLQGAADAFDVGTVTVRTAGGWWLSLDRLFEKTGERSSASAELIRSGATVRVVGRSKAATLEAGGAYSLLVFAVPPGMSLTAELAALRRQQRIDLALAAVGTCVWIGVLALAIVR